MIIFSRYIVINCVDRRKYLLNGMKSDSMYRCYLAR